MPVIDLNDYLGMPQQAPAQPVFRATTQNVDPMALRADNPYSSDAFLANVEARQRLAGLQRLAPVLQAQQAQLAYDKVAEDARLLRQKQEIEAQVQRATDEITQGAIDPESDQFNQQVMGLYTRNPMAFADPRMQQAMSFLGRRADELAQQKRLQAEADYEARKGLSDAINRAETRFLTGGGSINELNRLRQGSASPDDYISLVEEGAGKLRTTRVKGAGRGAGEPDIIGRYKDLKNEFASRAEKAASDLAKFEENAIPEDPGYDQKLAALKKAAEDEQALAIQASNAYIASLRSPTGQAAQRPVGPYSPEFLAGYGTAAGQGFIPAIPGLAPAPAPAGGAAAPAPFQETMRKLSGGGAPVVPELKPDELIKDIESNKTDPVFLITAINSPQRDEKSKDLAFRYLKKLQEDPDKIQFSYGNPSDIRQAKRDIQKTIEVYPALKEASRAWATEKKIIESQIKDFAKALSVSPELMGSWLKNNVTYQIEGDPLSDAPAREIKIRELFDDYLQNKVGKSLYEPAEILTKVAQKYPGVTQDIGLDRWFGLKVEEVLDVHLSEKFPDQGDNQGQPTSAVVNITTEAEFDALPIGAKFRFGDGEIRTKERDRQK